MDVRLDAIRKFMLKVVIVRGRCAVRIILLGIILGFPSRI